MRSAIFVFAFALLIQSCKSRSTTSSEPSKGEVGLASASAEPSDLEPPTDRALPTTNGAIALGNLEAQLRGSEKELASRPMDLDARAKLIELLSTHARFVGKISDLERCAELGEEAVKLAPDTARAYRLRAGTRAMMHRFGEATADLDEAAKRGMAADDLESERASIQQALGDYDAAFAIRKRRGDAHPDIESLTVLGALLGDMGQRDEAEQAFTRALLHYRDVSPFPVAWSLFQHATFLQKNGKSARAKRYFAAAIDRLPSYAHAVSHLADLESVTDGLAHLKSLANGSDDPENAAIFAALSSRAGQADQASKYREQARARYDALIKRHPEAFADHAARFFLGPGSDPARAAELAEQNLTLRKTPDAYELSIDASLQAKKLDRACSLAADGMKLKYATGTLALAAARAFDACQKPSEAENAREKARARAVIH